MDTQNIVGVTPEMQNLLTRRVGELFGMDLVQIDQYKHKVAEIITHARGKANSFDGILNYLADLKSRLPAPHLGELPINHFYRYVYLLDQRDKLNSEISKTENPLPADRPAILSDKKEEQLEQPVEDVKEENGTIEQPIGQN